MSSRRLLVLLICSGLWLFTDMGAGRAQSPAELGAVGHRDDRLSIPPTAMYGQDGEDERPTGELVALGMGGGAVGFLVGGYTALTVARGCSGGFCELQAAFYGAAVGGTFGMALAVHLGNRRRGSLALDFLTGAGIWGLGIAVATAGDWEGNVTTIAFLATPAAQLAGVVSVERAVGRSRSSERDVSLFIAPGPDGSVNLGVSFAP